LHETILNLGLLAINLIGFITMGIDKQKAKRHKYRIPEKTLWLFATIGGAPAMTIAMRFFHHKTKHPAFRLGFPLLALIQIGLYLYFYWQ
jgi:uncharacterized membrane protein YsdA (DUF1294 family)